MLPLILALLAAGSFHFGNTRFEPVDAIAYQVDVKDEKAPVTIVALTSFKIDRDAVLAAIDPVNAFYEQSADKGDFMLVRIVAPDRCSVSGFLGQGQQQLDLGKFPAKNTVSTASRIAGECFTKQPEKMFDDEYDFKLTYDTSITVITKPTKLGA